MLELLVPVSNLLPATAVQATLTAAVRVPTYNTFQSSRVNPFNKDKGHGECLLWQSKRPDPIQWTYMRLPPRHTRVVSHRCYFQSGSYNNVLGLKMGSWLIITHSMTVEIWYSECTMAFTLCRSTNSTTNLRWGTEWVLIREQYNTSSLHQIECIEFISIAKWVCSGKAITLIGSVPPHRTTVALVSKHAVMVERDYIMAVQAAKVLVYCTEYQLNCIWLMLILQTLKDISICNGKKNPSSFTIKCSWWTL